MVNNLLDEKKMDRTTQLMIITMEECGELTQVCSKLLRKRHTDKEISEETIGKLTSEVADVMCMIELMKKNVMPLLTRPPLPGTNTVIIGHDDSSDASISYYICCCRINGFL